MMLKSGRILPEKMPVHTRPLARSNSESNLGPIQNHGPRLHEFDEMTRAEQFNGRSRMPFGEQNVQKSAAFQNSNSLLITPPRSSMLDVQMIDTMKVRTQDPHQSQIDISGPTLGDRNRGYQYEPSPVGTAFRPDLQMGDIARSSSQIEMIRMRDPVYTSREMNAEPMSLWSTRMSQSIPEIRSLSHTMPDRFDADPYRGHSANIYGSLQPNADAFDRGDNNRIPLNKVTVPLNYTDPPYPSRSVVQTSLNTSHIHGSAGYDVPIQQTARVDMPVYTRPGLGTNTASWRRPSGHQVDMLLEAPLPTPAMQPAYGNPSQGRSGGQNLLPGVARPPPPSYGHVGYGSLPMAPPRRRKHIDPEKYNGKSCLVTYLENFEEISRWNSWSMEEKAMQLGMNLQGSAKKAFKSLSETQKMDYFVVVSCLRRNFGSINEELVYQEKFWQRRKNAGEELVDFAQDLQYCAQKAFGEMLPCDNDTYNTMLVNRFIAGLGDGDMGKWVHMKHPATLEEAISVARDMESYEQVQNPAKHSKPKRPETSVHSLQNEHVNVVKDDDTLSLLKQISVGQNQLVAEIKDMKSQMLVNGSRLDAMSTQMNALNSRVDLVENQQRVTYPPGNNPNSGWSSQYPNNTNQNLVKDNSGGNPITSYPNRARNFPMNTQYNSGRGTEIPVPRNLVGVIIGKGGVMIKKIQGETGARVEFKPDDGGPETQCIVTGRPDSVNRASEMIHTLLNSVMQNGDHGHQSFGWNGRQNKALTNVNVIRPYESDVHMIDDRYTGINEGEFLTRNVNDEEGSWYAEQNSPLN